MSTEKSVAARGDAFAPYLEAVAEVRRVADELSGEPLATLVSSHGERRGSLWWSAVAVRAVSEVLGVRLHDGQIAASLAMTDGWTVEVLTGEGKTFAAIGAALAFAAEGRRVHVVTANSYLAERDVNWSGAVLRAVGLTTGLTTPSRTRAELVPEYEADVVFGDVASFGFDFLRDGLWFPGDEPVQRELDVAIVDEADAVLIDQARTPLLLSAPHPAQDEDHTLAASAVEGLAIGRDVAVDSEYRDVALTDAGIARCEHLLGIENLYAAEGEDWPALIDNALRARLLLGRDRDYTVQRGDVLPIDELTGRVARGRRWPEGLQQAVEAKEGVSISAARRPAGQCTVGSYFSRYRILTGMSGTLHGADDELGRVFGIKVLRIPPHRPVLRVDHPDRDFSSREEALAAIGDDVRERHTRGQPVLIGTTSIDDTAAVSGALAARGITHATLTAVNDHEEAQVIEAAGAAGGVTVATQLAGRGVDIVLGGSRASRDGRLAVVRQGGLMVWGLGHHRSRRQDDQLRGRGGRQGDPGESCFAISPDDELAGLDHHRDLSQRVNRGQQTAERLDRELRDDVRAFEAVTDALHEHLYRWRQHAAEAASEDLVPIVTAASHRLRQRRRREDEQRQHLEVRRREVGAAFDGASRLILRTLLVVLWSETLEVLESQRAVARVMPIRAAALRRWRTLAVETYRRSEQTVHDEWHRQLAAFRVSSHQPEVSAPSTVDRPPLAVPPWDPEPAEYQRHDWSGPSYNRFVRRHWYWRLPDPPLVLHLDAIGDQAAAHGLTLHLDLEDPSNTVVVVT